VDGSVEVVAHGSDESLKTLEQALAKGPSFARVSGVEKTDVPHDMKLPSSFETR
jgi:acylphosphatase